MFHTHDDFASRTIWKEISSENPVHTNMPEQQMFKRKPIRNIVVQVCVATGWLYSLDLTTGPTFLPQKSLLYPVIRLTYQ